MRSFTEKELLEELFEDGKYWTSATGNKYKLFWCCDSWNIKCYDPICRASSCNCQYCEKCKDAFHEFNKLKTCPESYLTREEKDVAQKIWLLRDRHIPRCLTAGFPEINWEYLHNEGYLCDLDYRLFNLSYLLRK